ncbi:MAG: hypothetical protein MJ252_11540, partial [archaeon]|nr:hypothetical protein [archaeon]
MYTYRILSNYSKDMFHCSILSFQNDTYMFNCCDGTQRNALEQGIKFGKIKQIFFNSSHSNCYLGSYGFLMSRGQQAYSAYITNLKNAQKKLSSGDSNGENIPEIEIKKEEKEKKTNKKDKKEKGNKKDKSSKEDKVLHPVSAQLYGPP